jgi:hypothetical protein
MQAKVKNVQLRKRFDFRTHPQIGMVSVVGGSGKGHFYGKRSQLARTLRRYRRRLRASQISFYHDLQAEILRGLVEMQEHKGVS